ncbi:hypothetical protein [Ohtaekwangia koreensis]|uniref:Uncharacterized protein n=1 Tax=Ohtaekwangia koreensis TaxID=688867 RepID=A0A1T5LTU7_9BACT|nr:hypothetical protein [Ohtaekwangia koreensis]SKC78978.1 hypothetical protein SAMN05660236_3849 [Ohtaekwangia koreensis]
MKKNLIIILLTLTCCSKTTEKDNYNPEFTANASIDEIHQSIRCVVSEYDFSVIFFLRNDSNHSWYKMFSRRIGYWEKIEIRQTIIDEDQLKKEPDYYISRDITTRKLCKPEEAESFLNKLKAFNVFELPEESVLFKDCKDSGVTDLGSTYIEIVAGNKVRTLTYSGAYDCADGNEKENIYKIQELFEKEWFENEKGR